MKKIIVISFLAAGLVKSAAAGTCYQPVQQDTAMVLPDTAIKIDEVKQDEVIDEVIKSKSVPASDKVQYFSQVTKYGF